MNPLSSDTIHATAITVRTPASRAFAFLSDPGELHRWALAEHDVEPAGDNTVRGIHRLDGSTTLVRIDADAGRGIVDYQLAGEDGPPIPRIMARVVDGSALNDDPALCLISLFAWRTGDMDDGRWRQLIAAHEWEIVLLCKLLEHGREN